MKISILTEDCERMSVDRDSVANHHDRQGFEIWLGDDLLRFEDEQDVVTLWKMIGRRLGPLMDQPTAMDITS